MKEDTTVVECPLISVIMPVYNSGNYLETAIKSILCQSLKDFELLIVDDGSTDGSEKLCDEYAKEDSRVIVVHQKNRGICNARNTALKIARGEYIAFSDHDDKYLDGLLEDSYNRAKQDDADLVKFKKKEFIINDSIVVRTRETYLKNKTLIGKEISESYFSLLNSKVLDCVWDSLIRKDTIVNNDVYFDESFKAGGEDIDFMTRLLKYVNVFSLINKCYYLHYIRSGFSTSAKFNPLKLDTTRLLSKRITEGAQELGIDLFERRSEYLYQMSFTLINGTASLLCNKGCNLTKEEKLVYLQQIKYESYLPEWFFKQSTFCISSISKRYAFSYFLFKYNLYFLLFATNKLRSRYLLLKKLVKVK